MGLRHTLAILSLLPAGAFAQAPGPGDCALGRAQNDIDVGDVFARVFNTGSLFFGNDTEAGYVVPKYSGLGPFFNASLWVGGNVEGEFRVAAAAYANWEFWPGPLQEGPTLPDATDCSAYDRIWSVRRGDLERYYRTGEATDDLLEWPHELGAPVIDGDGDVSNYDLEAGDQPAISGDQTLWWVMNDLGNVHERTESRPIGLEVQVTAFGFAAGQPALRQATFYRYRFINRGASALEEGYVGFYADFTPGCSLDDYMASDTLRSMIYAYGGDDQDGPFGTRPCYPAPPAAGFLLQQGPVAIPNGRDDDRDGEVDEPGERHGMTATYGMTNGVAYPMNGPAIAPQFYHAFRGRWVDGTPITEGGLGHMTGGRVTTFMYAGDPVTGQFWSELRPYPTGGPPNQPYYRHVYFASGPFNLAPGETDEILLIMPFAQGTDRFDSIVELRRATTLIGNAFRAGYLDPRPVPGFAGPPPPPDAVIVRRPAPNPFSESATISLSLPDAADLRVALVDVLGREVAVLADGLHEAGPHTIVADGAALRPGVYVARVWVNGQPAAALPVTRR